MTNSNKSVFIDRNTSHIKHGWQEKRMIMEYNACVSCALIGHNFPTVLQPPFNHRMRNWTILFWEQSNYFLFILHNLLSMFSFNLEIQALYNKYVELISITTEHGELPDTQYQCSEYTYTCHRCIPQHYYYSIMVTMLIQNV